MVGGGFDLIKTDNDGFIQKAQIALEGNYFLTRQFTASAGFDIWTDDGLNFVIGGRWYPVDDFFARIRGIIGDNDMICAFIKQHLFFGTSTSGSDRSSPSSFSNLNC